MHAASRESLAQVSEFVDEQVKGDNALVVAMTTGIDLYDVVGALDEDRSLRFALVDPTLDTHAREGIVASVFGGKIAESALAVVKKATALTWSNTRDLRTGLITVARRAIMRAAESGGQLEQVETELFGLSRLLEGEAELTAALTDTRKDSSARRGLLADVLYGKVSPFGEALALQVIGRPDNNPIDDLAAVSAQAANLRGLDVAHVVSAVELNEGQRAALADKLERIYGRPMSIHTEVDPSLLGGMSIRVGDEVIDGTTRNRLNRARTALA